MPQLEMPAPHGEVGYGDGGSAWAPGPMVVLVHGAGGDRASWPLQARALARSGLNVFAPDLPGHGATTQLEGDITIERYAEWLTHTLECIPPEVRTEVHLVGHSMGACIAVTVAAAEAPASLSLLGAGAAMPVGEALLDDTLNHQARAAAFIAAFGHGTPHHFGGADIPGVWALGATRAQILRTRPEVLHADFAACNAWRSDALLPQIDCPTLVLIGAKDRMTPPRAGAALAEGLRARSLTLPDVGHMMMLEAPDAVNDALRAQISA